MCNGTHSKSGLVHREFYYPTDQYNNVLEEYKQTQLAIVFDLDENGVLDFILVHWNPEMK